MERATTGKRVLTRQVSRLAQAFTSWKLRWFVLDDETLRYWATPESEVGEGELGRIDLKDIIKMDTTGIAPSKSEVDLAFTVHATDRVFQLW